MKYNINPVKGLDLTRSLTQLDTRYVNVTGDTMTGLLTLSGAPTADLHAATKKYVDENSGGGGTSDYKAIKLAWIGL